MRKGRWISFLTASIVIIVFVACSDSDSSKDSSAANDSAARDCIAFGRNYNPSQNECFGQSSDLIPLAEAFCSNNGGAFNECASPCRHAPPDTDCAAVCEWLCKLL